MSKWDSIIPIAAIGALALGAYYFITKVLPDVAGFGNNFSQAYNDWKASMTEQAGGSLTWMTSGATQARAILQGSPLTFVNIPATPEGMTSSNWTWQIEDVMVGLPAGMTFKEFCDVSPNSPMCAPDYFKSKITPETLPEIRDSHGCLTSGGVTSYYQKWCETLNKCIKTYEVCPSGKDSHGCIIGQEHYCSIPDVCYPNIVICPTPSATTHPCEDGSFAKIGVACPTYTCKDGTKVGSLDKCPTFNAPTCMSEFTRIDAAGCATASEKDWFSKNCASFGLIVPTCGEIKPWSCITSMAAGAPCAANIRQKATCSTGWEYQCL